MTWNQLPPGRLHAAADLPGIDANLVWADASGWRDFLRPAERAKTLIPVIVELEAGSASAFAASVIDAGGSVPTVYRSNGTTHCTALLTAAHCSRLLRAGASDSPVRRLELQAPLIPQRATRPGRGSGHGVTHGAQRNGARSPPDRRHRSRLPIRTSAPAPSDACPHTHLEPVAPGRDPRSSGAEAGRHAV